VNGPLVLAAVVFGTMIGETYVSARHDRALRAQGAREPANDVYRVMAVAYPGAFLALLAEAVLRGSRADRWFAAGLVVFGAAKALKYWAIITLGPRWTFRVLVPPQSTRSVDGPYRWIAHPNYVGVAGELAGAAIALHAFVTGPVALAGFGALMWRRVRIEEAALAGAIESPP